MAERKDDYLEKIEKREQVLKPLRDRFEIDKKLLNLEAFEMQDHNNRPVKNVSNVTLNDPLTFAFNVFSTLYGANMQYVVEGAHIKDKEQSRIEEFLKAVLDAASERYRNIEPRVPDLKAFWVQHVCVRGPIVARCTLRAGDDGKQKLVPDIIPLDFCNYSYDTDELGIKWAAYRMTRTAEKIKEEYGRQIRAEEATVVDYWDREQERIYIDDDLVKINPNTYRDEDGNPYVPFVMAFPSVGSMLADDDQIGHMGESIFAANRHLYAPMNETASIFYTTTHYQFKPPMQYETTDPEAMEPPEQPPYGVGAVVPVEKDGGFKAMPLTDLHNAAMHTFAVLESRLQRGSLPAVDYGNVSFPLSAVAIAKLSATKDQLYIPRMQALGLFYRDLCYMIITQFRKLGVHVEIGERGNKVEYSKKDLDGDYKISFRFFATPPEQQIANYSVATVAREFVSEDTVRKDILQLEDPEEEHNKKLAELAEEAIPTLKIYRYGHALIEEGDDVGAQIVANFLGITVEQMRRGAMTPQGGGERPQEQQKRKPPELMPLLGKQVGVKGKSPSKAASDFGVELGVENAKVGP